MQLKLNQKETEQLLLDSIEKVFPGNFNAVSLADFSTYSTRGTATFTWDEPEAPIEPPPTQPAQ